MVTKVLGKSLFGFESILELGKHQFSVSSKELVSYGEFQATPDGNAQIPTGQLVYPS